MNRQVDNSQEQHLQSIFDIFSPVKKPKKIVMNFSKTKKMMILNEIKRIPNEQNKLKKPNQVLSEKITNDQHIDDYNYDQSNINQVLLQQLDTNCLEAKLSQLKVLQPLVENQVERHLYKLMVSNSDPLSFRNVQGEVNLPITYQKYDDKQNIILDQCQQIKIQNHILQDKENLFKLTTLTEFNNIYSQINEFEQNIKRQFDSCFFENQQFAFPVIKDSDIKLLILKVLKNDFTYQEYENTMKQTQLGRILQEVETPITLAFYNEILYNKNLKLKSLTLINKKQRITSDIKEFEFQINQQQNVDKPDNKIKPQIIYIQNNISHPPTHNQLTTPDQQKVKMQHQKDKSFPLIHNQQKDKIQPFCDQSRRDLYKNYQNKDNTQTYAYHSSVYNMYQSQVKQNHQQTFINPCNTLYQALPLQARIQNPQISPPNKYDPIYSNNIYNSLQQSHYNETQSMSMQSTKVLFVNQKFSSQQGIMMQTPQFHILCVALAPFLFQENEFAIIDDDVDIYLLFENDLYSEASNNDNINKYAIAEFYKFVNRLNLSRKNIIFFLMENDAFRIIYKETNKIRDHNPDIEFFQISNLTQINNHILSLIQMGVSQINPPVNMNKIFNLSYQIDLMDQNKLLQKKKMSLLYQTLCSFLF